MAGKAPKTERNAAIVAEYERGNDMSAIAERHGISRQRVWQVLRREGVTMRTLGKAALAERNAVIIAALQAGEKRRAIAARYGISRQRVSQIVLDALDAEIEANNAARLRKDQEVCDGR